MNIYRYKNCLKFKIWNCTLPQIDGHAICIFNIISKEFRLFKFGTWGGLTYYTETPFVEISDITDEIRELVKRVVIRRIHQNSSGSFPDGTIDIVNSIVSDMDLSKPWNHYTPDGLLNIYIEDFFFIYDNYVGDVNEEEVKVSDYYENWTTYCLNNLNPKIVCTK